MPTTCDRVEEQLSSYRDGEMSRLRQWRILAHVQRCARCSAVSSDAEDIDFRMRCALAASEPPDYLAAAVMRRLPAMPPAQYRRGLFRRWPAGMWLMGLGCAIAQLAALWGAYRCGYSRGEMRYPVPVPAALGAAGGRPQFLRPAAAAAPAARPARSGQRPVLHPHHSAAARLTPQLLR
jgi:hypothetical protein